MSQPDACSGSSNFVNQKLDYVNLRSNFINQPAVEPDKPDNYAALQGTGSSQNEYKQLKQVNCRMSQSCKPHKLKLQEIQKGWEEEI